VGKQPEAPIGERGPPPRAIAGANPIALMTKAGHANMSTTRRYLRLAGTVFPDEAAALEARILGVTRPAHIGDGDIEQPIRSTEISTRLADLS
jgi:hypothetical protein